MTTAPGEAASHAGTPTPGGVPTPDGRASAAAEATNEGGDIGGRDAEGDAVDDRDTDDGAHAGGETPSSGGDGDSGNGTDSADREAPEGGAYGDGAGRSADRGDLGGGETPGGDVGGGDTPGGDAHGDSGPPVGRATPCFPATGPLAGRTVLVARPVERGAGLAYVLRSLGAQVLVAPVTGTAPPDSPGDLDAAVARVGEYDWVAVTSVNGVDSLARAASRTGVDLRAAEVRWAAVGPATATALRALGVEPEVVARGTAAHLADELRALGRSPAPAVEKPSALGPAPSRRVVTGDERGVREARGPAPARSVTGDDDVAVPARHPARSAATHRCSRSTGSAESQDPGPSSGHARPRVLLPLGDLAGGTLARGLAADGWEVARVVAYRTIPAPLPDDVAAAARERRLDLAVVAAGSAARALADQLGPDAPPVVTIGEPSAAAARAAGLDVAGIAAAPTDEALAACVTAALTRQGIRGWNPGGTAPSAGPAGAG